MITPERGWNTWHPVSCSRLENLPAGLSIVPGAFSEAESSYTQFPFDTETRLLEHESSGRYCRMRVSHACAEFELEYLRFDAWTILFRMTNLRPPREWGIRYHMLVSIGLRTAAPCTRRLMGFLAGGTTILPPYPMPENRRMT